MSFLFGFSGRIGRLEWWLLQTLPVIVLIAVLAGSGVALGLANRSDGEASMSLPLVAIIAVSCVVLTVILVSSTVKRLHDRNKSGFWYFLSFVRLVGPIWLLVECGFLSGSPGGNDYGHRPPFGGGLLGGNDDAFPDAAFERKPLAATVQPADTSKTTSRQQQRPAQALGRPQPSGFGRRGA